MDFTSEEQNDWDVVQKKKPHNSSGHLNSLYFYVDDNREDLLESKNIPYSRNNLGERKVYHIDVLLSDLERQKCSESIFEGYKFLRAYLSIDLLIKNQSDPLSDKFTPAHGVLVYQVKNYIIKVRVYYHIRGRNNLVTTKKYPKNQESSHPGDFIELSKEDENFLKIISTPCFNLFEDLQKTKSRKYLEIFKQSLSLDNDFSVLKHPFTKATNEQILKSAKLAYDATIYISRYNDTLDDPRTIYYQDIIASLSLAIQDKKEPDVSPDKHPKSIDTQTLEKSEHMCKPLISEEDIKSQIEMDLDILIETSRKMGAEIDVKLVNLYLELDDKITAYTTNYKTERAQEFVNQQRSRLPFESSIQNIFKSFVSSGDLEKVSLYFPLIAHKIDMSSISYDLITQMIDTKGERQNLIKVADFLFKNSPVYRMVIMSEFRNTREDAYGNSVNWLLIIFHLDYYDLFCMMLRHAGISKQENQTILNDMFALYATNPKIEYIQALLDYDVGINLSTKFEISEGVPNNTLVLSTRALIPDVVQKLLDTKKFDIESVLLAFTFSTLPISCATMLFRQSKTKNNISFSGRDNCASSLFNPASQESYFVYIPLDATVELKQNHVKTINILLREIYGYFSTKSYSTQQRLIDFLERHATLTGSSCLLHTAILAYTLMPKHGSYDHESMLRISCTLYDSYSNSEEDIYRRLAKMKFENGYDLLQSIPETTRLKLKSKLANEYSRRITSSYLQNHPAAIGVSSRSIFPKSDEEDNQSGGHKKADQTLQNRP
ncbi:MAG: hypothetical protein P1U74_10650 [Legionellaceae bacterium]|nr:hypothetical protein [Legionellaceae bacterium]